ncbi:unnamed protein product [Rhizopus stolonifer]
MHAPPVPATTDTSDLLSPFQSAAYTPVSTPNKENLDTSAPASVATSTAHIYDNCIIGLVTPKFSALSVYGRQYSKTFSIGTQYPRNLVFGQRSIFGSGATQRCKDGSFWPGACPCSEFTLTDFMTIVDVVSAIDAKSMSPKQARLQLLTLASKVNDLPADV